MIEDDDYTADIAEAYDDVREESLASDARLTIFDREIVVAVLERDTPGWSAPTLDEDGKISLVLVETDELTGDMVRGVTDVAFEPGAGAPGSKYGPVALTPWISGVARRWKLSGYVAEPYPAESE